jgi:hypothetical protein
MSIQRTWDPKRWNRNVHRAMGNFKDAQQLNAYLDAVQGRVFEIQKEYTLKNQLLTPQMVIQKLTSLKSEKAHMLIEVFQYHNNQFEKLVGLEFSNGTFKKFKTALNSISWSTSRDKPAGFIIIEGLKYNSKSNSWEKGKNP